MDHQDVLQGTQMVWPYVITAWVIPKGMKADKVLDHNCKELCELGEGRALHSSAHCNPWDEEVDPEEILGLSG